MPPISPTQWQQLIELLGNASIKPTDDRLIGEYSSLCTPWIIDTGATNHVTGNLNLLKKPRDIIACSVGLPDCDQVASTKCGSACLTQNLELENVLYVPKLNCNLIFVSHLIDDLDCSLLITKNWCTIQDQSLRTLIGVGERRDGLLLV